jgi:hypothetical protein
MKTKGKKMTNEEIWNAESMINDDVIDDLSLEEMSEILAILEKAGY